MNIKLPELHYHSMTAHAPAITVPLTALAYAVFLLTGNAFYYVAHACLTPVTFLGFFVVFATGYLEREKKYVNWTRLFVAKMVFSGLHIAALAYQLAVLALRGFSPEPYGAPYAVVTVGLQTFFMGALTWLGVVTAQGRIGGRLSYRKDPEYRPSYNIVDTVKNTQPDPLKEAPYDRL